MPTTVFFSWQADTEKRTGRNLIERALGRAISRIAGDVDVEEAPRDVELDRDTKGVPGSPPIIDTIFRKIDAAAVFVPDLTFVGTRIDGRPTPNPNVLVEYGWALKSRSHSRVVAVLNTAHGEPHGNAMPFDMRHMRNPITFHCEADASPEQTKRVTDQLAKELERAIRAVFESDEFKASLPKAPEPRRFDERKPADGYGRFKLADQAIGVATDRGIRPSLRELFVSQHPVSWFRMMPTVDPDRTWSVDELAAAMQSPFVPPLNIGWRGYDFVRSHEGCGAYSFFADQPDQIRSIVFAFTTGEVWSIDTYWLEAFNDQENRPTIPTSEEKSFRAALTSYGNFLLKLGIKPPFKWIAGMQGLKGRMLYIPLPPGQMRMPGPHGKCVEDVISESGIYAPGDAAGTTLKPFFDKLYNACGLPRGAWQDA